MFAAQPGGSITSQAWSIPNGTMPSDGGFFGKLSVAVTVPNGTVVKTWGIELYATVGGQAQLLGGVVGESLVFVNRFPVPVLKTTQYLAPPLAGDVILDSQAAADGDAVTVVAFADVSPASSVTFALGRAAGLNPMDLPVLGSGVRLAHYSDFGVALYANGTPVIGEAWTPDTGIAEALPNDLRPMEVRDVTFTAAQATPAGTTIGVGLVFGNCAGTWSVKASVRGLAMDNRSTTVPGAAGLVLGLPLYAMLADGNGTSRADFHLTMACPDDPALFIFYQLDLGATLTDLVGAPGPQAAAAVVGLLGNVPPQSPGGPLRMPGGGLLNIVASPPRP